MMLPNMSKPYTTLLNFACFEWNRTSATMMQDNKCHNEAILVFIYEVSMSFLGFMCYGIGIMYGISIALRCSTDICQWCMEWYYTWLRDICSELEVLLDAINKSQNTLMTLIDLISKHDSTNNDTINELTALSKELTNIWDQMKSVKNEIVVACNTICRIDLLKKRLDHIHEQLIAINEKLNNFKIEK